MRTSKNPGQVARRVFLWSMIASFTLAAGAGILALLGLSLDDTGGQVLLTTVVVGLYSLAMLCCAAVFGRPERLVGIIGVAVAALSMLWSLVMVWSESSWIWDAYEVLLTGITLTVAASFLCLMLTMTSYRDAVIRWMLGAAAGLITLATVLTVVLIWWETWESETFGRFYGIVLILAVLTGVVTPLLSALRRRAAPGASEPSTTAPQAPARPTGVDPQTAAALQAEAQHRGITVAELVAPLLEHRNRPPME
ncbi:hypothetical protein [Nesterenkonia sp. HG001]|uniref:hypothetical protein n=1 Tax=Nesterenkonia sp. HG001 TaxID=2983207 RepID=UPI002AC5CE38|nr:hypothetical protein [Nesterenkonia sp. HG001]MDZ5077343.1 hypothetical protein [Nesterenkonia sp. HG001]